MKKLFGLAFLGGLIFGCIEGWNWIRYRTPVEVAFSSNEIADLPKHVTLKDVFLLPNEIVSQESGGKYLFIPIRSMTDQGGAGKKVRNLHFLLKTRDAGLLGAYARLSEQKSLADDLIAMKPLLAKREVSGMLDRTALTSKQQAKILQLLPVLAADFTVLEEGRHPSLFTMLLLFGMSALVLFILGKLDPTPDATVAPPLLSPTEPPLLPGKNK